MSKINDGCIKIGAEDGLEGCLNLLGVRGLEVLERRIAWPIWVRIDEGIEGIRNGYLRMRIPRKAVLRELLELGGHPAEFVDLPRGRAVVIDEAKQCLFLTTKMAVERPRKKSLRPYHYM